MVPVGKGWLAQTALVAVMAWGTGCQQSDPPPSAGPAPTDAVSLVKPQLGDPAAVRLVDLDGHELQPLTQFANSVQVYLFTRTDCPIANRYVPETNRIVEAFQDRGVTFHLVYPDPSEQPDLIRRHLHDYSLVPPALRDPRHHLVRYVGASVTPEAAVFDSHGHLVYRGRIDDRAVDFGKQRFQASKKDLVEAIEAAVAGRSPTEPLLTRAVGCYIESEPEE